MLTKIFNGFNILHAFLGQKSVVSCAAKQFLLVNDRPKDRQGNSYRRGSANYSNDPHPFPQAGLFRNSDLANRAEAIRKEKF